MLKPPPAPSLKPPLSDRDHILGPPDAKIELVEYGDFECPHCGRAFIIVQQLLIDVQNQVRFSYRHFPLAKMHPHARKAAEAAEAAGAQGKFWEMHDALFKHQQELEPSDLARYASEIGLDVARFETELTKGTYAEHVQEDVASGVRSGVNGTPTFFLNGTRYNGSYDYDALRAAIGI